MSTRRKPIYSTREDDPDFQEPIDTFVVALAERIDGLQDLHSSGELDLLAAACEILGEEAQRLGYPLMASVARVAAVACRENKADASEEALVELTELSLRIRQAHRGAA